MKVQNTIFFLKISQNMASKKNLYFCVYEFCTSTAFVV